MAWFMDTYSMYQGRTVNEIVTGKPVALGGTRGRREATGRGVSYLVERALDRLGLETGDTTAVVQGFGNVGSVAALSMAERGIRIVGISDYSAAYYNPKGIDVGAADAHVRANGALAGFLTEFAIDPDELLVSPCTVLVPAAVEQVITAANAGNLKCRVLAEAANGPTTPEADAILDQRRDLFVIPDILCNAGGVIVSYFEWVQDLQSFFWDEEEVLDRLRRSLNKSFQAVLGRATRDGISNRNAALAIGVEKVREAKTRRGLFP
jgi:glutamate dehydrogenase (NAD(P)+)